VRLVRLVSQYNQRVLKGREVVLDIVPELSLSFPESDIHSLSYDTESEMFSMVATFLGLYGVSSPLPTFYTEDLMDDVREDITVGKDFLDIIHRIFYRHLIAGFEKYKLDLQAFEAKSPTALNRLYSLMGLGEVAFRQAVPDARSLLRYTGLFAHFPRSAAGLKTLLSDYFQAPVNIVSGYPVMEHIAEDQRLRLCRMPA
jgi:type VI secretion system protein ImpH